MLPESPGAIRSQGHRSLPVACGQSLETRAGCLFLFPELPGLQAVNPVPLRFLLVGSFSVLSEVTAQWPQPLPSSQFPQRLLSHALALGGRHSFRVPQPSSSLGSPFPVESQNQSPPGALAAYLFFDPSHKQVSVLIGFPLASFVQSNEEGRQLQKNIKAFCDMEGLNARRNIFL